MGKLSVEQQKMLEELTAIAEGPDEDDYEVEIFQGDRGARIPVSQARSWLHSTFGIGDAPAAPAAPAGAPAAPSAPAGGKGTKARRSPFAGAPSQPPEG